jgi:hypothetical protein
MFRFDFTGEDERDVLNALAENTPQDQDLNGNVNAEVPIVLPEVNLVNLPPPPQQQSILLLLLLTPPPQQ